MVLRDLYLLKTDGEWIDWEHSHEKQDLKRRIEDTVSIRDCANVVERPILFAETSIICPGMYPSMSAETALS